MESNAARLDDHHVCPEHVGAGVLPACAPTILIEGAPAARVGDQLTCHLAPGTVIELAADAIEKLLPWSDAGQAAPLDTIRTGEPTVLLEGKPAARFADGTAHGGLIDQGCPTVIIGTMTAAAKRMRLLERLRLIDAAQNKAAGMAPGRDKDRLLAAARRLARNNKAVEHARLCDAVYNPAGAPPGWQRVTGNKPPFVNTATGFYSAIYRSEIDGSYVLTFRGTEPETWQDWVYGNTQTLGALSPQYLQAALVADLAHSAYGDSLGITGHSLGGGLASVASLHTDVPATTINAAGINLKTYGNLGLNPFKADDLIDAYRVDGEILTGIQEFRQSPLPESPLPDAIGRKHLLPALNPDGTPRPNPLLPWEKLAEAKERHDPAYVVNGIEAQKAADVAALRAVL